MKRSVLLLFIFYSNSLLPVVIGSEESVAREPRIYLRSRNSNSNLLQGFSVFNDGILLEDKNTIARFASFFPLSGDIILNGGSLILMSDVELKNPSQIGVGTIIGQGFALELPRNVSSLEFPAFCYRKIIQDQMTTVSFDDPVALIDWSHDDQYFCTFSRKTVLQKEATISIAQIHDNILQEVTYVNSKNASINCLKWHPNDYYFITSSNRGIIVWYFNQKAQSIERISSEKKQGVQAVAWSASGNHVVVGTRNQSLEIFSVNEGKLEKVVEYSLGEGVEIVRNCVHWNDVGNHLAVCLKIKKDTYELCIFNFDGNHLILESRYEVGNKKVTSLSWNPTASFLSVVLQSGKKNFLLFEYDYTTRMLLPLQNAQLNQLVAFKWGKNGKELVALIKKSIKDYEMHVYQFDGLNKYLSLTSRYTLDYPTKEIHFNHNQTGISVVSNQNRYSIFSYQAAPLCIDNLKVFFNSEVNINSEVRFKGECVIDGNGSILEIGPEGSLFIESNSSLRLEDLTIRGIKANNIRCEDDSSSIKLRDVKWIQEEPFEFLKGSCEFSNEINCIGRYPFIYRSSIPSMIHTDSVLRLHAGFSLLFSASGKEDILQFEDSRSILALNGATLGVITSPLSLKVGSLQIERDSFLVGHDTSISLGTGKAEEDCKCDILSGAALYIKSGELQYKNKKEYSWNMESERSLIQMMRGSQLTLYENLNLGSGVLVLEENCILNRRSGKKSKGRVNLKGRVTIEEFKAD